MPSSKSVTTGQNAISPSDLGAMGELFVCLCVMAKGGQVLRNQSPNGSVDLAVAFGPSMFPVDVKVCSWAKGGRKGEHSWRPNISGVPDYVYPVIVIPEGDTDFQQWQVRWSHSNNNSRSGKFRCPPGLENFWSKNFTPHFH